MKELIIKEPYIDLILQGKKIWEIRSSNCHKRETIALIKSGTKKIFGTVDIVNTLELTEEEYYDSIDKHCVEDARGKGKPYKNICLGFRKSKYI